MPPVQSSWCNQVFSSPCSRGGDMCPHVPVSMPIAKQRVPTALIRALVGKHPFAAPQVSSVCLCQRDMPAAQNAQQSSSVKR